MLVGLTRVNKCLDARDNSIAPKYAPTGEKSHASVASRNLPPTRPIMPYRLDPNPEMIVYA
jgi:hypothetical protein